MAYKDKEKGAAYVKEWLRKDHLANPEKYRLQSRMYYETHREAESDRRKKWKTNNPDYQKTYNVTYWPKYKKRALELEYGYRRKLKLDAFNRYGGPICACCKEQNLGFLSIDHIVSGKKKSNLEKKALYKWLKQNDYPDGFRVLCYNCNLGRDKNKGICPHETAKAA